MSSFESWFATATGQIRPHAWQQALAQPTAPGDRVIRIPTGFGKTLGVLGTWAYHVLVRQDTRWPRRLIWTLPMRVLVEQTEDEARRALTRLGLLREEGNDGPSTVGVYTLMGGVASGDWHLRPEAPAVLVGTQDMLLSRAMNRGYGASRARWPAEFGLLSQDALWVLDEVQLMDVGFATALQLAAFRKSQHAKQLRPSYTWAMSATLQRDWLEKSPDTSDWVADSQHYGLITEDRQTPLWSDTEKPLQQRSDARGLAALVKERHNALQREGALTLVVVNTVDRANELYGELKRGGGTRVTLLHSRFRGLEREAWKELLQRPSGGIIVATQVIEAGVDLSADLLVTEICPWTSLFQRLGRLARRGGRGEAIVVNLDDKKQAAPYEPEELEAAWNAVSQLVDGSPRELERFENANPSLLPELYPFEPQFLLLEEELKELFDTTPDLSGADLDISRYIRASEERDVSVFWIEAHRDAQKRIAPPPKKLRPRRESLVAVPFLKAREWLFGKGKEGSAPQALTRGRHAWVWDYVDGCWREARRDDLWPGQTVCVDAAVGGYSLETGWEPRISDPVYPLVAPRDATPEEASEDAEANDELSELAPSDWQTVAFHGQAVGKRAGKVAGTLSLSEKLQALLLLVGRWHDLGKSHPAFQAAIVGSQRPDRCDLAKAPKGAWRSGRDLYGNEQTGKRPGFRHELASTLGWFTLLAECAPPEHPARLGEWAELAESEPQRRPPSPLEQEILDLSPDDFDLAAFLICSHHGKVRARLHASPLDQKEGDGKAIRGVRERDRLPAISLFNRDGELELLPSYKLSLQPAALGLSARTGRSWTDRVDRLLQTYGPFTLAFLESIVRSADVRASQDACLVDPSLVALEVG